MQYVNVEDCCDILDSLRIPVTASDRREGKYPYYGANGLQDYVDSYIFDDDLVLLAEDGGNFGSKDRPIAYRVSGKCWVNNHAHVLRPKEYLNVDYLCYSLMFYRVDGMINGATRQKLTQASMRKMKIPLRNIEEQLNIVKKLNEIVKIKNKQQKTLKLLDTLIKSRFVEMFGDLEKGNCVYPVKKLNDLSIKISDGVHAKPQYTESGKPFLSVVNINKGVVDFADCKYVSDEAYQEMIKSTNPRRGDVLYTKVGATYGIPAYVDTDRDFCLYVSVCLIKPRHEIINSRFLAIQMGMPFIKHQADERIRGIGVPDLHLNQIREFNIICPEMSKQNLFVEFVQQVDKLKVA